MLRYSIFRNWLQCSTVTPSCVLCDCARWRCAVNFNFRRIVPPQKRPPVCTVITLHRGRTDWTRGSSVGILWEPNHLQPDRSLFTISTGLCRIQTNFPLPTRIPCDCPRWYTINFNFRRIFPHRKDHRHVPITTHDMTFRKDGLDEGKFSWKIMESEPRSPRPYTSRNKHSALSISEKFTLLFLHSSLKVWKENRRVIFNSIKHNF